MRILLVSHDFLPRHPSGTEIYTYQLGKCLKEAGHDVHVFTTEKDISKPNLSVELRHHGGLPVHELINNLFYNEFRETWDYPPAVHSFARFLDDLRPDLVHFMHLMYLSVGCVEEVARRSLPVIFTLHDYWLQCPRFGQRIHADGSICHRIDFEVCGGCMASFKYRQSRLERATAKGISSVRRLTGLNLGPAARRAADFFRGEGQPNGTPPQEAEAQDSAEQPRARVGQVAEVAERDRSLRERLLPVVDRFVAPSRFLRDRFVEWGIPAERILFNRAGIDTSRFQGFERAPGTRLRVAYIGTLAPHKGVHVLLEAWDRLPGALRERGQLTIWGPKSHYPAYLRRLEQLAARVGIRLSGGLRSSQVVGALREVDVLVVPSVWYENSPLIILEALATRTPLIVSDLGGMAELVQAGVSGMTFHVGDPDHLAQLLARCIEHPEELAALYPDELPIKPIEIDAAELAVVYDEVQREVAGRSGRSGGG